MKVTAQVELASGATKTLGYATIMLDDQLVIDGFKIVAGDKKIFVSPPSVPYSDKSTGEQKYKSICRYTTPKFKAKIEKTILSAYRMAAASK